MHRKTNNTAKRQQILDLYHVEGNTIAGIAKILNLPVPEIEAAIIESPSADIQKETTTSDQSSHEHLHLQRLEHQWREAMAAWHRSKSDEETTKVSRNNGTRTSGDKLEQTRKTSVGDVRYLQVAQRVLLELRELKQRQLKSSEPEGPSDVQDLTLKQRRKELNQMLEQKGDQQSVAKDD